ncbi:hypothetical protein CLIB1423_34S00188 [[Candida] railenensis]|uniref:Myosin-binding domain-containing protein n=1 Tax=[Candida] railenensis TaxID=45579 RepID=A0A9P0QUB3_9ASCO|nr:hypothetical protein CLIB1423_34S00188 [[Candida] railenensis]
MNFGYITNYLSSSVARTGQEAHAPQFEQNGEISDWGIDETPVHSSRSTSISLKHPAQPSYSTYSHLHSHATSNPAYTNTNYQYSTNGSVHNDTTNFLRHTTTNEEISSYIKKYLSLNNCVKEFWEKFKYDLIVSSLLDESMILSKNEQAIKDMSGKEGNILLHRSREYAKMLNDDGTRLKIYQRNYNLRFPSVISAGGILQCIHMIIYSLKSKLNGPGYSEISILAIFKILLIISTKIVQRRRILTFITVSKVTMKLQQLLLNNYKVNKSFMVSLLRIKEEEIFNFMNKPLGDTKNGTKNNITSKNSSLLDHAISILIIHLTKCIKTLLPYMNGPAFEKYCSVNNVNWNFVSESEYNKEVLDESLNLTVQSLSRKLARFNQIRKVFLCQLLTFDEIPDKNFFLCKLWDDFEVQEGNIEQRKYEGTSELSKLAILHSVMDEQNKIISSIEGIFERTKFEAQEDQDVLASTAMTQQHQLAPSHFDSDDTNEGDINNRHINQLIDKLTTLTTNLKFFEKYNKSTSNMTDVDELNEKIFIFNQFGNDLNNLKELHQVYLNEISSRVSRRSQNSTPSSSNRNSREGGDIEGGFSLKSFHTSSSIKKRFSLPVQPSGSVTTPKSSPIVSNSSPSSASGGRNAVGDKKYKRLSAGLPVGLLTVFEEPNSSSNRRVNSSNQHNALMSPRALSGSGDSRSISLDDNYINILPPTSYYNETYNHAALEALSRKQQTNSTKIVPGNRYSLNSMNSNVSGISDMLASTNQTSEQEDPTSPSFSKEDLKLKLEESFNRIYSLESENSKLKQQLPLEGNEDFTVKDFSTVSDAEKSGFLSQLETKLQLRTDSNVHDQTIEEED